MRAGRVVGRCYVCQLPVLSQQARRVADASVLYQDGRPVRRLVHSGDCELELTHRIGGGR